jgi:hypothetical protein
MTTKKATANTTANATTEADPPPLAKDDNKKATANANAGFFAALRMTIVFVRFGRAARV